MDKSIDSWMGLLIFNVSTHSLPEFCGFRFEFVILIGVVDLMDPNVNEVVYDRLMIGPLDRGFSYRKMTICWIIINSVNVSGSTDYGPVLQLDWSNGPWS